jgi:hypothetical protein
MVQLICTRCGAVFDFSEVLLVEHMKYALCPCGHWVKQDIPETNPEEDLTRIKVCAECLMHMRNFYRIVDRVSLGTGGVGPLPTCDVCHSSVLGYYVLDVIVLEENALSEEPQ